jgi:hypothetical protein
MWTMPRFTFFIPVKNCSVSLTVGQKIELSLGIKPRRGGFESVNF